MKSDTATGTKCGDCGGTRVPPAPVCSECYKLREEFIKIGSKLPSGMFSDVQKLVRKRNGSAAQAMRNIIAAVGVAEKLNLRIEPEKLAPLVVFDPPTITKRIRLPDGRFITRKLPVSRPGDLAEAKEDQIWESGDGRRLLPKDMESRHIVNAMRTLEKRCQPEIEKLGLKLANLPALVREMYPIYATMAAELAKRVSGEPDAKPGRKFDFTLLKPADQTR